MSNTQLMHQLQTGFYTALLLGLGYDPDYPLQIVQPPIPLIPGQQADKLLWNYFNNIPPFSLNHNYVSSGGDQFFSNYRALLSGLEGAANTFAEDIGDSCYRAWQEYLITLSSTSIAPNQLPGIFRTWAMKHGFLSVADIGASSLSASLLDPISTAQLSVLRYAPDGPMEPDWVPGYTALTQQLAQAPAQSFTFDSNTMSRDEASTWSKGRITASFGLLGNSSLSSTLNQKFATNRITVDASFMHILRFEATPGDWYSSAAMGLAYTHPSGPPWVSDSLMNWNDVFGSETGSLARFATGLFVADTLEVSIFSTARFNSQEQEMIEQNLGKGMWPFFASSESDVINTTAAFKEDGRMIARVASKPGVPIIIGLSVLPVNEYLGHASVLMRAVRVTVDRYVCEMADDEGPDNNVDMDRFSVYADAFNGNDTVVVHNKKIHDWQTSDEVTMGEGATFEAGSSIELLFDAEHFETARLILKGYARDFDDFSSNEEGSNSITLLGNEFFKHGGKTNLFLYSDDFRFRTEITISKISWV